MHPHLLGASLLGHGKAHAQAQLGVVFEQGVGPRRTESPLGGGIGNARHGRAPGLGAAGGVRPVHALTEQLGEQLGVRGFAATGTGGRKLHQRGVELGALHRVGIEHPRLGLQPQAPVPTTFGLVVELGRLHGKGVGGTHVGAASAAGAVELGNQQREPGARGGLLGSLQGHRLHALRGALGFIGADQVGTDDRMGAHEGAAVALDAGIRLPAGRAHRDTALFEGGQAHLDAAVLIAGEGADGQVIALLGVHREQDAAHHVGQIRPVHLLLQGRIRPLGRNRHLHHVGHALVDGGVVHGHDLFALGTVGADHGVLHLLHRLVLGHQTADLEERRLQHHVHPLAQANAGGNALGVDGEQPHVAACQGALHGAWQTLVQLIGSPGGVQQEHAPGLDLGGHVVLVHVALVVAGHQIRPLHVVGGADGLGRKAQMGLGHAEGLLGVVLEVGLGVQVGEVSQNGNGIVGGAHRAVAAQTPELAAVRVGVVQVVKHRHRQGKVGHVVLNAHGEAAHRLFGRQVAKHRHNLRGVGVLGAQSVATADHAHLASTIAFGNHPHDVLEQGLAGTTHDLAAIHDRNALHAFRQGRQEMAGAERTVQVDLQEAVALLVPFPGSPGVQVVHGLLDRAGHAAHGHHHVGGVRGAVVVEQMVGTPGDLPHPGHVVLHNIRQLGVGGVVGLANLEVHVAVLDGGPQARMLRVQRMGAEAVQGIPVHELDQLLGVRHLDAGKLVRGAEAVEEVHEGNAARNRGKMGHRRQVRRLLHAAGAQLGKAGVPAGHDVGVVAEDAQSVSSHGAAGHMQHAWEPLARNAVEHRHHEHQALAGGVAGAQRAGLQRAVDGTYGPSLRLHLHQLHRLAEHVQTALGAPLVRVPRHGRRRGDGVDGRDLREIIGHVGRCLIAVDGNEFAHVVPASHLLDSIQIGKAPTRAMPAGAQVLRLWGLKPP